MDSHTHNSLAHRLEVVEVGRRRRWSEDEKLRIVIESLEGSRQGSATARRYGISPSLLFTWRRTFEVERTGASEPRTGFVPAVVVPERETAQRSSAPMRGRMVIVVGNARRVIVGADVDAAALARVLEVLERQ